MKDEYFSVTSRFSGALLTVVDDDDDDESMSLKRGTKTISSVLKYSVIILLYILVRRVQVFFVV